MFVFVLFFAFFFFVVVVVFCSNIFAQIIGYNNQNKHSWAKIEVAHLRKVMRYVFTFRHVAGEFLVKTVLSEKLLRMHFFFFVFCFLFLLSFDFCFKLVFAFFCSFIF